MAAQRQFTGNLRPSVPFAAREQGKICPCASHIRRRKHWRMGLGNELVQPDGLARSIREAADEIPSKSAQSIRMAKATLDAGSGQEYHSSCFLSAETFTNIHGNEENMEGANAFLEKRNPDFFRFRANHD